MSTRLFDQIWSRLVRVIAFAGGMAIMGFETIGDHADRPYLYAAAIGMMGLPGAHVLEELLARIFDGSSGPRGRRRRR